VGFPAGRAGQDGEAAEWLRRAVAANPRDFNSAYLLGTVLARRNDTDAALRAWRGALALQPGNRKLMQVMSVEYSKGRYFAEAARMAEAALQLAPEELALYLVAIKARQDAGQHEEAFALARRALAKFPASARANFEVGFHLHKLGRWDEAMPYFEKAIAGEAGYEEPHYFRGDVLLRREDFDGAAGAFRTALEKRADYTVARLGLARALMAQGKLAGAVAELQEATRRDEGNAQPYLLLSQALFRMGKAEEARVAKETSQRLRTARPEAMNVPQARPFPN
jgi:Flp pilus assembly protein TadD